MTEQPSNSGAPQHEAGHHHEAQQVIDFLRDNAMPLAAGIAIVVVGYVGFSIYRGHQQALQQEAQQALQAARSVEELRAVAEDYAETPAAAPALLQMGAAYVHNGEFAMARQAYGQFLDRYPDHFLAPAAELGEASAMEGQQEFEAALERYRGFREARPGHYLAPTAILGEGRVLQAMGQLEEARTCYEDFIASQPDSRWRDAAQTALLYVRKDIRARSE